MSKRQGTITAPSELNIQPHEMNTARALADAGYDVEFVRRTWGNRATSADIAVGGILWEMKSPHTGDRKAIERNLRRGSRQSSNIVFDSQRVKGVSDGTIERTLRHLKPHIKAIKRLWFVDKERTIVDIV